MKEEKPRPVDLQEEPLLMRDGAAAVIRDAAADVVVEVGAHDIHMQELVAEEEARRLDLIASDEAVAHALYMADLEDMEETESELPGGLRSIQAAQERRASAQDPFAYFQDSPPGWITFPGDGASPATALRQIGQPHPFQRYVADLNQDHATPGARPIYFGVAGLVRPLRISAPPPRIVQDPAPDVPASPATGTVSSCVAASAGASSSQSVPDDKLKAAAQPGKALPASDASSARCAHRATALGRIVAADEVFFTKRWTLLAEPDASTVFSGMEDVPDNDWYKSIADDEQMEELELDASFQRRPPRSETPRTAVAAGEEHQVHELLMADAKTKKKIEDPGVHGSLQQYFPRSEAATNNEPYNPTAAATANEEGGGALSLPKLLARPSNLDPDEAGPSTKRRTRVHPLDEDDVPMFDCGICFETLPIFDVFHGLLCEHRFCVACMVAYVEGRIGEGALPIPCPDPACKGKSDDGALHPERCKKMIDFAAFTNWGLRLVESAVPVNQRTYCPNRRCGIMLITSGEDKPAMAPCPACNHLLCAACGMEWSADDSGEHDCAKGPEVGLLKKLAADRRWKQCPRCKMMVERISGCRVMACRCRCVFCYQCGKPMGVEQGGDNRCQCQDRVHVVHANIRN